MSCRNPFVPECPNCGRCMQGGSGPEPECIDGWNCQHCGEFLSDDEYAEILGREEEETE
jgi:hypothetical protein